ncbi:hypothetical protein WN55_04051 [Dufourea novaeangliae]|uniref:Uncharacterized protein n=1 Tax=Dufourea novaeangliae TaxID=178035 RepID=A0A154NYG0_DUFNO|nr:hypothetical protein WN55_04051 [Dufourea novaeangliae]
MRGVTVNPPEQRRMRNEKQRKNGEETNRAAIIALERDGTPFVDPIKWTPGLGHSVTFHVPAEGFQDRRGGGEQSRSSVASRTVAESASSGFRVGWRSSFARKGKREGKARVARLLAGDTVAPVQRPKFRPGTRERRDAQDAANCSTVGHTFIDRPDARQAGPQLGPGLLPTSLQKNEGKRGVSSEEGCMLRSPVILRSFEPRFQAGSQAS